MTDTNEWQVLVTTDVGDPDWDALVLDEVFPTWELAARKLRDLLASEEVGFVAATPGQNWYGEVGGDTYSLICTGWVTIDAGRTPDS